MVRSSSSSRIALFEYVLGYEAARARGQYANSIAQPTQIHPDDREGYISAILADLEHEKGAVWCSWPEEGASSCTSQVVYFMRIERSLSEISAKTAQRPRS